MGQKFRNACDISCQIQAFQQHTARQHLLHPKDSVPCSKNQCCRRLTLEINIICLMDFSQSRAVSTTANVRITQSITVLSNEQILYGHMHGSLEKLSPILQTLSPNIWVIQIHNKS